MSLFIPEILAGVSVAYELSWGTLQLYNFLTLGWFVSVLAQQSWGKAIGPWSFGQVVAVTVWAPVLAKYIYLNIFGVKRGFNRRLPDTHYVMPKKIHHLVPM